MKSVSINGIARVNLGKSFAKKLRNEENVPCVIYGGNESPIHFYAHSNEFRKIVYTADVFLIDVNVGDETVRTVMGDIQFHPVTDKILHIDFIRVFDDKSVKINVPVNISGNSIGVRNGGRLTQNMRSMKIEAFAKNLPETIEIDIANLKIGQSIRVSDLELSDVTFLNNSNDVIVAVKTARTAIASEEEDESIESADSSGEASNEENTTSPESNQSS